MSGSSSPSCACSRCVFSERREFETRSPVKPPANRTGRFLVPSETKLTCCSGRKRSRHLQTSRRSRDVHQTCLRSGFKRKRNSVAKRSASNKPLRERRRERGTSRSRQLSVMGRRFTNALSVLVCSRRTSWSKEHSDRVRTAGPSGRPAKVTSATAPSAIGHSRRSTTGNKRVLTALKTASCQR